MHALRRTTARTGDLRDWLEGDRVLKAKDDAFGVMTLPGAGERIRLEVTNWPGVEAVPHRFGGTAFMVGQRELGHVHGDAILDAPVPREEHDRLIAEGRAMPHHALPESAGG